MKAIDRLFGVKPAEVRGIPFSDGMWMYNGSSYYPMPQFTYEPDRISTPDASFQSYVNGIHKEHGVIAAAVEARALLLSELRFQWRSLIATDNGKLFGNAELTLLEQPNSWQTRAEFLKVMEYHASYAGNAYAWKDGRELRILNPQWVSIVLGSQLDPESAISQRDLRVVQYLYQPGGDPTKGAPQVLDPAEIVHYRPEPDPVNWWRGSSWVQSILSDWATDKAASNHTQAFFENGATPNLVISLDPNVSAGQVKQYAEMVADGHAGAANAYRTLVMGGGADATVVGSDLARLDLKSVQGLSETRIALRARVPAVILGISEGMQGSSLNAGNYSQARRMLSDGWFTPTAHALCAALESVLKVPSASELAYDPKQIMFLQDDRLDEAKVMQANASTLRSLLDAGFTPETAVLAVNTSDMTKLKHSGLFSVQLQPAGSQPATPTPAP